MHRRHPPLRRRRVIPGPTTLAVAAGIGAVAAPQLLTVAALPAADKIVEAAVAAWKKLQPAVDIKLLSRRFADPCRAMSTALSTLVHLPCVAAGICVKPLTGACLLAQARDIQDIAIRAGIQPGEGLDTDQDSRVRAAMHPPVPHGLQLQRLPRRQRDVVAAAQGGRRADLADPPWRACRKVTAGAREALGGPRSIKPRAPGNTDEQRPHRYLDRLLHGRHRPAGHAGTVK